MTDPLGNQGIVPRPPSTDMEVAADGGPGFMERLQSLAEVKNAADRAVREMRLGEAAQAALKRAEAKEADATDMLAKARQMKAAAEDAYVVAGHDLADSAREVEKAQAQAKAIVAAADKRSAQADQRIATAERAESDLMEERTRVRLVEKAAEGVKRDYEARLVRLRAGLDEIARM